MLEVSCDMAQVFDIPHGKPEGGQVDALLPEPWLPVSPDRVFQPARPVRIVALGIWVSHPPCASARLSQNRALAQGRFLTRRSPQVNQFLPV